MQQAVALQQGSAADVGMDPARIELIRERARGWVANGDTPSLVLLVARKGVIVLEEAYGILRPSDNAPLQTDSIFPVKSISKSFTAVAVMSLVEDGLLSLKHPITDYFPEIATPGADQVLIADLLTHTSGYEDLDVFAHVDTHQKRATPVPAAAEGQHPVTNRVITYAGDAPLARGPGETMSYSNFGYWLLGDLVRRVSGRPFWQFVASRIFEPLGMKDSYFVLPSSAWERRVIRQQGYPGTEETLLKINSEQRYAGDFGWGGAASTARDVAIFAQMLLNGGTYENRRVLSRASVAAMTTPELAPGTPSYMSSVDPSTGARVEVPIRGGSYGYGLFIATRDDRTPYMNGSLVSPRTISHAGAHISNFWADPDAELVGVYLSVMPRWRGNVGDWFWKNDHFQDMVHAAILD